MNEVRKFAATLDRIRGFHQGFTVNALVILLAIPPPQSPDSAGVREIAVKTGISRPNVSRIVQTLVKDKYATRKDFQRDRRLVIIRRTPLAEALLNHITVAMKGV